MGDVEPTNMLLSQINFPCMRCSKLHCENCPNKERIMSTKKEYGDTLHVPSSEYRSERKVCTDPDKMHGAADQFPGSDYAYYPDSEPLTVSARKKQVGAVENYIPKEYPKTQQDEKLEALANELRIAKDRILELEHSKALTFDEYSKERILAQGHPQQTRVESFGLVTMGLAGEVGEFTELIKKHFFHGKELNRIKALNELGDILWYTNYAAHVLGSSLEEVAKMNNVKLRHRYPNGFDINIAKHLESGK